DRSCLVGRANPIAPPLRVRHEGPRAIGTVTFTRQYEGAPGVVHGGFVAAAIDQVFGYAVCLHNIPSMTGSLTIRYKRPTPLHREVRIEADLVRDEGRRVHLEARAYDGETLLAEGETLFIRLRDDHYKEMVKP
ncbi:MAG: PaaI family thioesterase, partial [Candidatus Methylomirabilis sp.]|nr:PaaI family thioesterase [Deltaproteobacteria bacterium]